MLDILSSMKKKTLGQFLQETREQIGLTLRAAEKDTGISNAYLSQLEAGKIQQPSPVILHKLSELYKVSYADLMELAGYPVPNRSDSSSTTALASRIGPVTKEEEEALAEYLQFMRSRRKRGKR
jgi:transcriptional regulator with XRE-family HTH domain